MKIFSLNWLFLLSLFLLSSVATAAVDQPYLQLPAKGTVSAPRDTQIIPKTFLRRWDPVTIFFDRDVGPDSPRSPPAERRSPRPPRIRHVRAL